MGKIANFRKSFRSDHGTDCDRIAWIEYLSWRIWWQISINRLLFRNIHSVNRMSEHEPIHANHYRKTHDFGYFEGLNMHIDRLLIVFNKKLNPAAVTL